jgi:hypothetical protein
MSKIDFETVTLLREALAVYIKQETQNLAAQIYLNNKGGVEFEEKNPSKEHAWFSWAEDYEKKLEKLKAESQKAAEYLDSIDPFSE